MDDTTLYEKVEFFTNNVNWNRFFSSYCGFNAAEIRRIKKHFGGYEKLNRTIRIKRILFNELSISEYLNVNLSLNVTNKDIDFITMEDILIRQGIPPEKVLYWYSVYDKYDKRRENPVYIRIEDTGSIHICRVLKRFNKGLPFAVKTAFNNVLNKRHGKFMAWILKTLIKNTNDTLLRNSMALISTIKKL